MSVRLVACILVAISIVGTIAIPLGDPRFIDRAIALEIAFVGLAVLTLRGVRAALYGCLPLAAIVMVGNSLAPPHVEIMTTFSKPLNAVLLIIGGYVLQVALVIVSLLELARSRKLGLVRKEPG